MSEPGHSVGPDALHTPQSALEIFRVFNRLALQGFGGVLAVAQRELVERQRWLDATQFLAMLSLGQVLPGPNIVNMALMIGDRFLGWRGAAAALGGLMCVPLFIVLALAALYGQFVHQPMVAGALRGMGAVAAGLVIATALKLVGTLRSNVLGWKISGLFAVLALLAVGVLRWPMVGVVLGLGTVAVATARARLR
jgi:chromate transporter